MTEKKTINIEQLAYDSKGNIKFLTFVNFIKKTDQNLINSFSVVGLSLLFGVIFLCFSLLAVKMTMILGVKISYLILSSSLTAAGFSFFLYSLLDVAKQFKLKRQIKNGLEIESEVFQSLLKQEKERQKQQLQFKTREIQKHQIFLEELRKFSFSEEADPEMPQKVVNIK